MYCFTYCNVPQSKRSLWGYLWWWEENLKTSQYFVNIAVRRQHGKVRGWRRQGIRNQGEQRPAPRGFWRQVMMERRSGLGSRSTLDCLGTRLVPAHFWRQAQKVCTPHRLFRLGVIQRMEDILVFPVNHVFSILSNVIHTAWKFQKETVEFVCNLWWCLYLVLGKLKKELILFRNILGIFQCFPKKYFFVFISCKIWITFSAL